MGWFFVLLDIVLKKVVWCGCGVGQRGFVFVFVRIKIP